MEPTKLIYMENFSMLDCDATVVEAGKKDAKDYIILDKTILYAQGGGQPYDTGIIQSETGKFIVQEVRYVDGVVLHFGALESGNILVGQTISCTVDAERRRLHSRLHSGGHAVDWAVLQLELPWIPGKGYHFPDGPYVEYAGSLVGLDKEELKAKIEKLCAEFVAQNRSCELRFMEKEKMHEVCRHVPEHLPEGKPARVVMFGDFGVPCGGTHISYTSELGKVTIRKIKADGPNIRVGYDVSRD